MTRAKLGINTSPSARTTLYFFPGPTRLTTSSARRKLGNAVRASFSRISTSSTRPPKYPVTAPTSVPMMAPMETVERAMASVVPLPFITRLKISLPKLSVPKRCWRVGGWKRPYFIAVGGYGVQNMPITVISSITPVMISPARRNPFSFFFISVRLLP